MRNASGHQGENEQQWKNTDDILTIKRVTKKFLEVSSCSSAKQGQSKKCTKKCAARAKLLFYLLDPLLFLLSN